MQHNISALFTWPEGMPRAYHFLKQKSLKQLVYKKQCFLFHNVLALCSVALHVLSSKIPKIMARQSPCSWSFWWQKKYTWTEAKKADADVIVTIGGGSLTDGAKVVRIALQTGVTDADSLGQYCFKGDISAVKDTKLIPQARARCTCHILPSLYCPLSASEVVHRCTVLEIPKEESSCTLGIPFCIFLCKIILLMQKGILYSFLCPFLHLSLLSASQVSVPTTLSAGEFAPYAGCTDPGTKVKETYVPRLQIDTDLWIFHWTCHIIICS